MAEASNKPVYERFAVEAIVVYIGGLIILFGVSLFYLYTPGWFWTITPQAVWFILGWTVFCMGVAIVGGAAYFRHHTRKLIAGNKMFQLAFPKRYTIDATYYPIDEAVMNDLPEPEQVVFKDIRNSVPGTNAQGRKVRVSMLLPGGIDHGGFKSLEPGSQGAIMVYGDDQLINLDECTIIPYILDAMDHTEIPPEAIAKLEKNSHFTRGKTPIYSIAGLDPGFDTWLRISPTAQSVVLGSIGYDGLVDRLLARMVSLGKAGKLSVLIPNGKTQVPSEVLQAIQTEVRTWLLKQSGLKVAMGQANADSHYWRRRYFETQSQVNNLTYRLRRKDNDLLNAESAIGGRLRDRASVYGRVPEPLATSYANAATRPQTLAEQ